MPPVAMVSQSGGRRSSRRTISSVRLRRNSFLSSGSDADLLQRSGRGPCFVTLAKCEGVVVRLDLLMPRNVVQMFVCVRSEDAESTRLSVSGDVCVASQGADIRVAGRQRAW